MAIYSHVNIQISTLIALLVCLIPTTIGGLLSAIGIAGMDRVTRFNVIAMSGKAVEACGDVDTMILDKTGTITFGNRLAAEFTPVGDSKIIDLINYAVMCSLKDDTPEGKSIVELGNKLGATINPKEYENLDFIEFSAQTRMSGIDLSDGSLIRKGSDDAIRNRVKEGSKAWRNSSCSLC
jgi:K+-transporting ATPase ATPase B chain